jgi:hypothetical protein
MTMSRPEEGQAVRAMLLGSIFGVVVRGDLPVKIRDTQEWVDEDEIIQAFSVVTESGLKYRINVVFEGEEPT